MARFRKTVLDETVAGSGEASTDPPGCAVVESVRPVPAANVESHQRYERLASLTIRTGDPEYRREAVREAARLRCLTPVVAASTDRNATQLIARFVAAEANYYGAVDARRAFRRVNVDRHIHEASRKTERSVRELRSVLYGAGRLLHPREFPAARVLPAPRFKRQVAASSQEIHRLEDLLTALPQALRPRLQLLLDLGLGVGARSADVKTMRGTAVAEASGTGRDAVVTVTLPNLAGGSRVIPVADPGIAKRLMVRARQVGPDKLLLTGGDEWEKNAVNRVAEAMVRLGHAGVNLAALRNTWILRLSERIPAALLMQLADVVDIRVLSDQRSLLRRYDLSESIHILEATR